MKEKYEKVVKERNSYKLEVKVLENASLKHQSRISEMERDLVQLRHKDSLLGLIWFVIKFKFNN